MGLCNSILSNRTPYINIQCKTMSHSKIEGLKLELPSTDCYK